METLYNKHRILISQTNLDIIREVMHTISWDRQLVGIAVHAVWARPRLCANTSSNDMATMLAKHSTA